MIRVNVKLGALDRAPGALALSGLSGAIAGAVKAFPNFEYWEVTADVGGGHYNLRNAAGQRLGRVVSIIPGRPLIRAGDIVLVGYYTRTRVPYIKAVVGKGNWEASPDLPAFDWIQSLINPYLSLSHLSGCPAPTTGGTTLVTIAQDAQASSGMQRFVGMVSLGDCWVMVTYRANAGFTGYDWVRIRAYNWDHTLRWNTVLAITARTNAQLTDIPYSSNLFWDPNLRELIMLDFEARAWPLTDTAQAPTVNYNRSGPFRRFAGYSPISSERGSMLHHNAGQIIHYPYVPGAWGVLPEVKIHTLSDLVPAGHAIPLSGQPTTASLDTSRFLNRPWACNNGVWSVAWPTNRSSGLDFASKLYLMHVDGTTGDRTLHLLHEHSDADLEIISMPIRDAKTIADFAATMPAVIPIPHRYFHPGTEGAYNVMATFSGNAVDVIRRGFHWVEENPSFDPDYDEVPGWDPEDGPWTNANYYTIIAGSEVDPLQSQFASVETYASNSYRVVPQVLSAPRNPTASINNFPTTAFLPSTLIDGLGNTVIPLVQYVAKARIVTLPAFPGAYPSFLPTYSVDSFEVTFQGASSTSPPYTGYVKQPEYSAVISLPRITVPFEGTMLYWASPQGSLVGKLEVSPRIPWIDPEVAPSDAIPIAENIWQIAAGHSKGAKGWLFLAMDGRRHFAEQARLQLVCVSPQRTVAYRSGLLGSTTKLAATGNPYSFQYSGQTAGLPQVRLLTNPATGRSFLLLGLWMRKTTNGTAADTGASDQWSTDIWVYDVTTPAAPALLSHFYEAANTQTANSLPKGDDFRRLMVQGDQIFFVTFSGGSWRIQRLY